MGAERDLKGVESRVGPEVRGLAGRTVFAAELGKMSVHKLRNHRKGRISGRISAGILGSA